jgi:hypothetical protein
MMAESQGLIPRSLALVDRKAVAATRIPSFVYALTYSIGTTVRTRERVSGNELYRRIESNKCYV